MSACNLFARTQPIFGNNIGIGTSEYERCFCLQSIEKAMLTLTMRADNRAGSNNTFSNSIQPAQITYTAQSGLKVGRNCIRVRVNNEGGPTGFAVKATLQGFGAQDNALEGCCRRSAPVFTEPLRVSPVELDPRRKK